METTNAVLTTQEIANKLVDYCRKGDWQAAQTELYADDALSIEADPNWPEVQGKEALLEKGKQWEGGLEAYHGGTVSDPIVANGYFSAVFTMDITPKGGQRFEMSELAVFEVQNGKVVKEQFFYPLPPAE